MRNSEEGLLSWTSYHSIGRGGRVAGGLLHSNPGRGGGGTVSLDRGCEQGWAGSGDRGWECPGPS